MNDRKMLKDTNINMGTSERNTENGHVSCESEVKQQEERVWVSLTKLAPLILN